MSSVTLATKYIVSAENVLKKLERVENPLTVTKADTGKILQWATDYLEDAKYYKEKGKFETSLTSVAYCEGLLDALRLLGAVKFEWPANQERAKLS